MVLDITTDEIVPTNATLHQCWVSISVYICWLSDVVTAIVLRNALDILTILDCLPLYLCYDTFIVKFVSEWCVNTGDLKRT